MNVTRNGKFARLPHAVRQDLNRRLCDGEQRKKLVAWLNALPTVQAIVAAEFGGKPIREQNLSEWKQGGYRDWLLQQEALTVAERLGEDAVAWDAASRPLLTDTLALWLAARYAAATPRVAEANGLEGWQLLREMCADVVELRRGDHSAKRLELERERVAARKSSPSASSSSSASPQPERPEQKQKETRMKKQMKREKETGGQESRPEEIIRVHTLSLRLPFT